MIEQAETSSLCGRRGGLGSNTAASHQGTEVFRSHSKHVSHCIIVVSHMPRSYVSIYYFLESVFVCFPFPSSYRTKISTSWLLSELHTQQPRRSKHLNCLPLISPQTLAALEPNSGRFRLSVLSEEDPLCSFSASNPP